MAYSPEMLYAATGTSTASRTRAQHVEVGQRGLHHHDVGALADVEQRLADALDGVARGPAGRCAGRPQRGVDRLAERAVERRGVLRRVGQDRDVAGARRRRARRGPRATWPSIIPLGPDHVDAGRGLGDAPSRRTPRGWRRCRPRRRASSTPQWPWSVNSSRHRSPSPVSASPTSATTSAIATLRMPVGVDGAAMPSASLVSGMPNSITPAEPEPRPPRRPPCAASRGCAGRRPASSRSAAARSSALAHEQRQHQLPRLERRSRRPAGAAPAYAGAGGADRGTSMPRSSRLAGVRRLTVRAPCVRSQRRRDVARSSRRADGLRSDGLVTGWPASSIASRRDGTEVGERVDEHLDRRRRGQHVDPQAVLLGGLGRRRADHRDHRRRVRLAGDADQVAHRRGRGEDDRVELAGLDRVAGRRRRRGGPHGAVRRDVVDTPSRGRSGRRRGSRWRCRRAAGRPG